MKRIYLHPLPLRLWHWVNTLLVLALLVTGFSIRLKGVADLGANSTLLLLHRYLGWAMIACWLFWLAHGIASGGLKRHYALRRRDGSGMLRQAVYYLFSMFRGEENPFRPTPEAKFNALQKLAYGAVMWIFMVALALSGVLFSDVRIFRTSLVLWNGVRLLEAIHVVAAYVVGLYVIVHIYMASLGPTWFSHTKEMIVGYEQGAAEQEE